MQEIIRILSHITQEFNISTQQDMIDPDIITSLKASTSVWVS